MKKASGFYNDSLEMLLDTMCNLLGAIVFIALIVALMAQDSPAPPPTYYLEQAAHLSNELAALTASNSAVEAELQKTLLRLQDPHLHAVTNLMRLPNISNTAKQPWQVIVRYGELFPLEVLSADRRGVQSPNTRSLRRQAEYVEPSEGMGQDPERGVEEMLQAFKASGKMNYYFAFWVYDDSFDAFVRARETATRLGFQYGWEPVRQDEPLKLGAQGQHVPPQN